MYYVRFLKSPQYGTGSHQDSCKALVTITTDLGDKFYHKDVSLHATLLSQTGHRILPWKTVQWRSGMRTLWLEIKGIDHEANPSNQTLLITPRRSLDADQLQDDLLHIVSARIQLLWPMSSDMPSIVREVGTSSGHVRIHEGLGDSIARHIWDASIGLMMYFDTLVQLELGSNSKAKTLKSLFMQEAAISVLELGTGTGIAGLFLASIKAHCSCLLTDVGEAMELLNLNASTAAVKSGSTVSTEVLDWEEPLPKSVQEGRFDLFLISDCTYNPDTAQALVGTLASLMQLSPQAKVLVAAKTRHESEKVFFELLSDAGLAQLEECSVPLSNCRADGGAEAPEHVMVCVYGLSNGSCILGSENQSERILAVSGS